MARILVVDDDVDLLQMIRMLLESRGGHEAILSADGEDGIAEALADPPDLAIIDVVMPGITGYEVCRRLRQEPATANIPIIVLIARGQPVDREAALAAGADVYIAKPVTMAELLERVNDMLTDRPPRPVGPVEGTVTSLSLPEASGHLEQAPWAYRQGASRYDSVVGAFNLLRWFGFDIPAWRSAAVRALALEPGTTVVDVGCGTGLNFSWLQEAVGPEGKIVGVDLSQAMLDRAHRRAAENGWPNVELLQADAAQFEFPPGVAGVLSTFALVLIPECGQVIRNGCEALRPGGRWVVLDMAWPAAWPKWWRHLLFFLRFYGVTGEVIDRQPWKTVWQTMEQHLIDVTRKRFWMGAFYLAAGARETT